MSRLMHIDRVNGRGLGAPAAHRHTEGTLTLMTTFRRDPIPVHPCGS